MNVTTEACYGVRRFLSKSAVNLTAAVTCGQDYALIPTKDNKLIVRFAEPSDYGIHSIKTAHMAGSKTGTQLDVPTRLFRILGWEPGKDYLVVSATENGSDIVLSKALSEDIKRLGVRSPQRATTSGHVDASRYLYLTQDEREYIGIPRNVKDKYGPKNPFWVKCKLDMRGQNARLEISHYDKDADAQLEMWVNAKQHMSKKDWERKPLIYKQRFTQNIALPTQFARKCELFTRAERVNVRMENDALIVFGIFAPCDICGSCIPEGKVQIHKDVCASCADVLPAVQKRFRAARGNIDTVKQSLLDELADTYAALSKKEK